MVLPSSAEVKNVTERLCDVVLFISCILLFIVYLKLFSLLLSYY
jgi:hypothetical protein